MNACASTESLTAHTVSGSFGSPARPESATHGIGRPPVVGALDLRVRGAARPSSVQGDERADVEAVGLAVRLGRDGEQPAARDRLDALRADARRQDLEERGAGRGDVVDADDVGPLGADEQAACARRTCRPRGPRARCPCSPSAPRGSGRRARSRARSSRPTRTRRGPSASKSVKPRLPPSLAVGVLVVALVGGGERVVVDPRDGVGLAALVIVSSSSMTPAPCGPSSSSVASTPLDGRACRPRSARLTLARCEVDDREVVVLLQGDDRVVAAVDVDELGLGVVGRDVGEAGEGDGAQRQPPASPARSRTWSEPAGTCGIRPPLTSSSRSFSMTIAA